MERKSEQFKQFSCECGKQFSTRSELDKHRQTCATAQASGGMGNLSNSGQQTRGAGGSSGTNE
jgi:hypothetical protein